MVRWYLKFAVNGLNANDSESIRARDARIIDCSCSLQCDDDVLDFGHARLRTSPSVADWMKEQCREDLLNGNPKSQPRILP